MRFAPLLPCLAFASGLTALVGCTQILDIRDTTDPISTGGGAGSGGGPSQLAPLPDACEGPSQSGEPNRLNISMTVLPFDDPGTPSAGVSARGFGSTTNFFSLNNTVACDVSDAQGQVSLSVPITSNPLSGVQNAFGGFLYLSAPEYEPFFYFFSPFLTQDESFAFIALKSKTWADIRAGLKLANLPDTHAQITVNSLTSDGNPLAGAYFAIDESFKDDQTRPFFFDGTSVAVDTTGKGQTVPGPTALGGFLNVPARQTGAITVTMLERATDAVLGSINVYVRPGTWTTMRIKSNKPSVVPNGGG